MSTNKRIILGIVVILVVVAIILGIQNKRPTEIAPSASNEVTLPPPEQKTGELPNQIPSAPVLSTDTLHIVTYTDVGFSPATITIKKGGKVTFQNNSSLGFWPASGVHPTHNLYPEKGGCVGSKFDACAEYQPGESWTFQFNFAGSWKYHNHLAPSHTGTVVVTK